MASIRKRSWQSGGETKTAWVADYVDQSGQRHLRTFRTKKEADAALVGIRSEVAQGVHTPEAGSITVAEAAELWLRRGEVEGLERSTLQMYESHSRVHIVSRIGAVRLARLSTPMLESYRDELLASCSRENARKILVSLKSILREAERRGLVARNAATPVRIDAKGRDKAKLTPGVDLPSKEEMRAMFGVAAGKFRPFLAVATFTGLRASELRALTWADIDFEQRVLRVSKKADMWGEVGPPKSAAARREIPLSPVVINALKEWRIACPKGPLNLVFPNSEGGVEAHSSMRQCRLDVLQRTAGVVDKRGRPKYGLHSLRHFFASWVIERGFTAKKIQVLMGHSSIQITFDVYGHLFPSLEDDHAKFAAGELELIG